MSRPDFDAGDLVVRVERPKHDELRVGDAFRVRRVFAAPNGEIAVWVYGVEARFQRQGYGFAVTRFRKVRDLPESLTKGLSVDAPAKVDA